MTDAKTATSRRFPFEQVYLVPGTAKVNAAGYSWRDATSLREYLGTRVAERLKKGDGSLFLRDYLERMPNTGFSLQHLRKEALQMRPPRDWEVGEAFAEVILEDHFECLFPWPTAWDQREKEGHQTGPDLPGYHVPNASGVRFAFGEVKSTEHKKSPPAVVSGIDGKAGAETLVGQLRRLLTEPSRRQNLIAWLSFRETGSTTGARRFDAALRRYRETGDCLVVGCLVSGKRTEDEVDLSVAHAALIAHVAEALWREVREIFDYPVFTAAPDAVGITSTGAEGPNRLPEVLAAYRRFEAWLTNGAKPEDAPAFEAAGPS